MADITPFKLLIVAAVFVIFFGGKKLSDLGTSLGKSITNYKKETSGKESIDIEDKS